jgi:hypothetical protein
MGATVHQQPYLAIVVPDHNHGLAADIGHAKIALFGYLASMAYVNPAAREDLIQLIFENGRICIHTPVHAVIFDKRIIINCGSCASHDSLFL